MIPLVDNESAMDCPVKHRGNQCSSVIKWGKNFLEALTEHEYRVIKKAGLTKRQKEVAVLAARGFTNKEIGLVLDISPHTVNQHLTAVYRATGATCRVTLTRLMCHQGNHKFYSTIRYDNKILTQSAHRIANHAGLTRRQQQIAALVTLGHGNQGIAYALGISPSTVSVHLTAIYSKSGVASRVELTRLLCE